MMEGDARRFYDSHLGEFVSPERVRIDRLLIQIPGADTKS